MFERCYPLLQSCDALRISNSGVVFLLADEHIHYAAFVGCETLVGVEGVGEEVRWDGAQVSSFVGVVFEDSFKGHPSLYGIWEGSMRLVDTCIAWSIDLADAICVLRFGVTSRGDIGPTLVRGWDCNRYRFIEVVLS